MGSSTGISDFMQEEAYKVSNNQFKIIVVDDDKCTSDTLAEILTDEGFSAVAVESTREVLDLLKEQHWDLIISDVHRPGRDLDGIGMLKKIRSEGNQIPIILLTGFATIEITVEAMKSGVTDFLTKPTNAHKLFTAIRSALSATTRSNQVEALQPSIKNVLGVKPRIIAVDDDRDIQNLIAQLLNEAGYNAVTAGCNEEVSKILQSSTIDLIISDVMHPGGTGVELLQGIRKLGFNIPVILVTGCSMIDMAIEGIRAGASDFIIKPFTQNDLMCAVQRVLGHRSSILMERMYYPTGIIKREEYCVIPPDKMYTPLSNNH